SLYTLVGYSRLRFYEDTQNQESQSFMARMDQLIAAFENRTLFLSLWWKDLDQDIVDHLMTIVGDYCYWLEEKRNFKPHTLSEAEEKIINIKDVTGRQSMRTLYEAITNRYIFNIELNGEMRQLARDGVEALYRHQDPTVRAIAYEEFYRVYQQD